MCFGISTHTGKYAPSSWLLSSAVYDVTSKARVCECECDLLLLLHVILIRFVHVHVWVYCIKGEVQHSCLVYHSNVAVLHCIWGFFSSGHAMDTS